MLIFIRKNVGGLLQLQQSLRKRGGRKNVRKQENGGGTLKGVGVIAKEYGNGHS